MNLATMTLETFTPLEGTHFTLGGADDRCVILTLSQAISLGDIGRSGATRAPFSLLFRGPSGTQLDQRVYEMSHDTLGEIEVFLVPLQPDDQGPLFEAVFS